MLLRRARLFASVLGAGHYLLIVRELVSLISLSSTGLQMVVSRPWMGLDGWLSSIYMRYVLMLARVEIWGRRFRYVALLCFCSTGRGCRIKMVGKWSMGGSR